MSWDADITVYVDGNPLRVGDWNYTHNCSRMIYDVLKQNEYDLGTQDGRERSWWMVLDGMESPAAYTYLDTILEGLAKEPDRFRAMNPENKWGDYDSLRVVLLEMREKAYRFPSGTWSASG